MRVLFLTDNFYPEFNAPATRTYEHCKEWVKQGVQVTVITGFPNFPEGKVFRGYRNKWRQVEYIDGIKVVRVWTYIAANKGFLKRVIDFLSFMIMSFITGLFIKTDIIIATSPQFFTAISGHWLAFWKRKKWVMEVRDIWPESIRAVGAMKGKMIYRFFEILEHKMYQSAWKVITVTDSFKKQLVDSKGINQEKIKVVKNGINLDLFNPIEKDTKLLKELSLENKFILGYIGTHGMAHKLDFLLECAEHINDKKVHFLFLGTGAEKEKLISIKKNKKLTNVTMLPPVRKELVKNYISILDIGLVNLKKSDTFKSVLPSKIFELSAMHKPILLGVQGESRELVEQYGIGFCFEPENREDFYDKLDKARTTSIPEASFTRMKVDFDRKILASRMLSLINV